MREWLTWLWGLLRFGETSALGRHIAAWLPAEIRSLIDQSFPSDKTEEVAARLRSYFQRCGQTMGGFSLWVLLLFGFLGLSLITGWFYKVVQIPILVALVGLALIGSYALAPLPSIVHCVRRMPGSLSEELLQPLWMRFDGFYLALSLGLLCYVVPVVSVGRSLPIILIICGLWLAAPRWLFSRRWLAGFIGVRAAQFVILLIVATTALTFPTTLQRQLWSLARDTRARLNTTSTNDITRDWKSLTWFSDEGEPNVWFSETADGGFRLFDAPGFDRATGKELRPVADEKAKIRIVESLRRVEDRQREEAIARENELRMEAAEAEKRKADAEIQAKLEADRLSAERARLEAEERNRRVEEETRALEKAKAELEVRLTTEYVYPDARDYRMKEATVLAVFRDGSSDPEMRSRISTVISRAGLRHEQGIFAPAFYESAVYRDLYDGRTISSEPFRPELYARTLFVVELKHTPGESSPVSGTVMSASDIECSVHVVDLATRATTNAFQIKKRALGMSKDEAFHLAANEVLTDLAAHIAKAGKTEDR